MERLSGPVVSIAVNAIILLVLVNVVVFKAAETGREVAVQVVTPEAPPELEKELPPLEEPSSVDEQQLFADEPLPDVQPVNPPDAPADLSGLAVSPVQSPLVMKGLFAGRTASARAERLQQFAGGYGGQVEAAVVRALQWLAAQQGPAGGWGEGSRYNADWQRREWNASMVRDQRATRLTALCLLAFLAHGETPQSEMFGDTVGRAIDYLRLQQDPETGLFVPLAARRPAKSGEDLGVYAHAQAVYALAEAYALTRAPALKRPVERGVQVILDGQLECGAWGNWYEQPIADASATSWQVQALQAARAAGIRAEGLAAALARAESGLAYLYKGEGVWFYRRGEVLKAPREGGPAMSGAMVLCLQLLGRAGESMVQEGMRYLSDFGVTEWSAAWENPINRSLPATYEWYYNTQAVFQRGGSRWKTWNDRFAPMLLEHQQPGGFWRGPGQREGEETVYSTSLCTLALQVYYRILPSFHQQQSGPAAPTVVFDDDVVVEVF